MAELGRALKCCQIASYPENLPSRQILAYPHAPLCLSCGNPRKRTASVAPVLNTRSAVAIMEWRTMKGAYFFTLRVLARLALFTPTCLGILATPGFAPPAQALPSFARQTGQPCGTCHTDFPALTPFGRRFKLLGYTTGGGKFRTTPFPTTDDYRSAADKLRNFAKAAESGKDEADKPWVPPVSMMAIAGFTHTQAPLPGPTAPFGAND